MTNSRDAFPSAANTGVSTPLPDYDGPLVIRRPGVVIENVQIFAPQVQVAADNVTFRNVRFVYTGGRDEKFAMVAIQPKARGTMFENCEVDGRNGTARAITGAADVTVRRCNIHNTGNGVEVQQNFVVEDSFIHDIFTPVGLEWHADGVQARASGTENVRVTNNTILLSGAETSAVNLLSLNGSSSNVLVAGNLLGGGGWTVYLGSAQAQNYVVADNYFTSEVFPNIGRWGAWYPAGGELIARDNFVLGTGNEVGPP